MQYQVTVVVFYANLYYGSNYSAKPPAFIMVKGSGCHYNSIYNNTGTK